MWSRHRDSLHQIVASSASEEMEKEGLVAQEEAMMSVVERMEVELRELRELRTSPSQLRLLSGGSSESSEEMTRKQEKKRWR